MSIIHDALKKIQKDINKSAKAEETRPAEENRDTRKKPGLSRKTVLLSALAVCSVLFIVSTFLIFFRQPKRAQSALGPTASVSQKTGIIAPVMQEIKKMTLLKDNPITSAISKTTRIATGTLVLNGVLLSGSQSYALINDQIVKVADVIDGAIVKQIEEEEVVLERDNALIKLTLP